MEAEAFSFGGATRLGFNLFLDSISPKKVVNMLLKRMELD